MKKAIVTGITGQDGAYLTRLLVDIGYEVIGVTRNIAKADYINLRYLNVHDKITLLDTDLLNKQSIVELLEEHKPDEFYHLAGQSSVGASFRYPIETMHFNSLSVINILEAIRTLNAPVKFYQASSSEMFGDLKEENLPVKETLLFHPTSPYGISKVAAHWTAVNYREAYNIFSACGILFNHESCLRGKDYVTKKIIRTALQISRGEAQELMVGNTNIYRDWGYAPKYIEAMWLILQQDEPSDYLICSGDYMSLKTFIEKVFAQLGLDFRQYVKVDPNLKRKSDLPIIYGNNTKARKHLNWDYNMSIDELISQLITDEIDFSAWQKANRITQ